ncbi:flagellar basal body-associated protein FliL [Yersinia frederiksenii]|nr:flagellar basal body-associated protein FliL [Yersinia frederiksenii]
MTKKNQKANGGGKKFSPVVLLLMLISIVACALAGYTFYEMKNIKDNVSDSDNGKKAAPTPEPIMPLYVPLDTFTVSLKPTPADSDPVLYIGLTLRVKDDSSKLLADQFLPEIRSRLFILLAHQSADRLSTEEGKNQLIEQIKSVVSKPLAPNQNIVATDVLFNAFILR